MDYIKEITKSHYLNPSKLEEFNNINPNEYYYIDPKGFYHIKKIFVKKYMVHIHYESKGKIYRQLRKTGEYKKIWGLKPKLTFSKILKTFQITTLDIKKNYKGYFFTDGKKIAQIKELQHKNGLIYLYTNKGKFIRYLKDFNSIWFLFNSIDILEFTPLNL